MKLTAMIPSRTRPGATPMPDCRVRMLSFAAPLVISVASGILV
jgi:hypothetical protein